MERDTSEKERGYSKRYRKKRSNECKLSQGIPSLKCIGCEHFERPSEEGMENNNNSCDSDQNYVPMKSSSEIDWSFWDFEENHFEFINFLERNSVNS